MKSLYLFFLIYLCLSSCTMAPKKVMENGKKPVTQSIDSSDMTNNFYDNVETYPLQVKELYIDGEIANPGKVDFKSLPIHSVIVKETLLDSIGADRFVGAYRYDGY